MRFSWYRRCWAYVWHLRMLREHKTPKAFCSKCVAGAVAPISRHPFGWWAQLWMGAASLFWNITEFGHVGVSHGASVDWEKVLTWVFARIGYFLRSALWTRIFCNNCYLFGTVHKLVRVAWVEDFQASLFLATLLFVCDSIWGIVQGTVKHKTRCQALKTSLQHYLDPFAKDISFFISVMGYLPA